MKNPENKRYIKLGITGAAIAIIGLLFFFLLFKLDELSVGFNTVVNIVKPFIYGAIIAYILTPLCNKIEWLIGRIMHSKKEKSRGIQAVAIILSLIFAIAVIGILIIMVIPQVWKSVITIANAVPGQLEVLNVWLHDLLENQPEIQEYWDNIFERVSGGISEWLKTDLLPTVGTVISGLGFQLAMFFSVIKNLFLGFLISVYFLASRKLFAAQCKMLLKGIFPERAARLIEEEVVYADKMFNGFLMGKLLDSAIIGIICFAVTAIMGFESAALISVVVGVTNIIPFFGPFIGAIPSALLLLLENPMHCIYFIIFIIILQQLDGNLIGPKILGNTTGLSSFWVLFSILLFGGLWGILGMIIGVPLFAVIYDIVRRLVFFGLNKHGCGTMIDKYQKDFHTDENSDSTQSENTAE